MSFSVFKDEQPGPAPRTPWRKVRDALDSRRAARARERALSQKFVEGEADYGPFETGRAFRRRYLGERGYRFGRGELAVIRSRNGAKR